eukprot:647145-Pleurochrysis_carterae.AAC.2
MSSRSLMMNSRALVMPETRWKMSPESNVGQYRVNMRLRDGLAQQPAPPAHVSQIADLFKRDDVFSAAHWRLIRPSSISRILALSEASASAYQKRPEAFDKLFDEEGSAFPRGLNVA